MRCVDIVDIVDIHYQHYPLYLQKGLQMPVFRIQWLGEKAMILDTTYIERDDMIAAGTMASNRWTHSYHLIPDGCRGFYLTELFATETQTLEIKEIPLSQRPSKHDALIEKLMAESDEI